MTISVETDDLIDRAIEAARDLCGLELAYVSEFRDGAQWLRRKHGDETHIKLKLHEPIPLEGTFCQRVVDGRLPSVVTDARANPITSGLAVTREANLGAYVGVPLRLPDGQLYGTFCCAASEAHPELSQRHADMLAMLARMVGDQIAIVERATLTERSQNEFLASVSHDLRTPLKAVSFLAEDLAHGIPDLDPTATGETIAREVDRVLRMVDDVLLVSRGRVGDLALLREATDVGALATDVARTSAIAGGADGERIVLELPPEPLLATIDPLRVRQALMNLVDNALKYSPDGGRVTVRLRREETTLVLEVVDAGIGIDADDLPRIGERFFRAGSAREHGIVGIGLGLATVQAVAEAHEGVLSAESTRGRGSTFRLRLPLAPPAG